MYTILLYSEFIKIAAMNAKNKIITISTTNNVLQAVFFKILSCKPYNIPFVENNDHEMDLGCKIIVGTNLLYTLILVKCEVLWFLIVF